MQGGEQEGGDETPCGVWRWMGSGDWSQREARPEAWLTRHRVGSVLSVGMQARDRPPSGTQAVGEVALNAAGSTGNQRRES